MLTSFDWLESDKKILLWGSTGDEVKELQKRLGLNPDGVYSEFTMREVMKWQKKNNIQPNGMFGPNGQQVMGYVL